MKKEFSNNIVFKDIKEVNIIFLILIGLFLVGISGYSSYAIFSDEIVSDNEIRGVIKKQIVTGASTIIKKVGTGGLVKEEHPATSQFGATTAYRYTGKSPLNYVKFNGETWRIIGVFEVDDGTGNIEQRIKIISFPIDSIDWDSGEVNDWTKASGMTLLNSGDYWNRTGEYSSTGLTEDAKSMIGDAKWYLGGSEDFASASNGLASHFYSYERGTTVYSGGPTSWVGKVGLMYPSDYGYATAGGTNTNREACLAKEMNIWRTWSECSDNDWLNYGSNDRWTITPYTGSSIGAYYINKGALDAETYYGVSFSHDLSPTVYLKSDILITGGDGSGASLYTISLPPRSAVVQ